MTDHPSNDEREALIARGHERDLEPDEAADVRLLAGLLAESSTWAEPNADLEDAIVDAVANAELPASTSARRPVAGAGRTSARQTHRIVWPALAAVAALLIVAAAVLTVRGGASSDFTTELSGTELASGASASGAMTSDEAGFRITLDARGLPSLPADEYYQAWLKNAAGTLVPVGTFSSSDGPVTLWSGVSPDEFSTMTVTIEAADDDPTSSGRRVLEGEVRAS